MFTNAKATTSNLATNNPDTEPKTIKTRATTLTLETLAMEDPIKLNTAILNTLMDHKYHVTIKLKTIIKRLKPAIDKNSIYLSDDQLQKYGISRSRMDLEKGGRFFKPLSQPYFGSLARHEEFYEVGEWEADPDEVDDAKHICWRLEQLIQSEIPDSPKDRFGIPQAFYEYTSWGPTL